MRPLTAPAAPVLEAPSPSGPAAPATCGELGSRCCSKFILGRLPLRRPPVRRPSVGEAPLLPALGVAR